MRPWYFYKGKKYEGDAPPYYDLSGVPWYDALKKKLPMIREQASAFLKTEGLDIREYFNTTMVEGTKWEAVSFLFWSIRNEKTIQKGKSLFDLFKDVPGMVSLSVSILQPNTRIKGHYGDTDAIYRIHIPLFIPAGLPECGFMVSGIARPWTYDDPIVFCDAHFHEAWNLTGLPRMVLIIDVVKEEFLQQADEICSNVRSYLKYQLLYPRIRFIKVLPGWMKDLVRRSLKLYPDSVFRPH